MARPVGVTILAVLAIIGGILAICGGGALLLVGAAGNLSTVANASKLPSSGVLVGLGGFTGVLGIAEIVLGVGLLQLRAWAWTLGIVLQILGVISNVVQVATGSANATQAGIGIVISLIILFYLFTPKVRAAFGRG